MDISSNFENLKAQMMKKKELAESLTATVEPLAKEEETISKEELNKVVLEENKTASEVKETIVDTVDHNENKIEMERAEDIVSNEPSVSQRAFLSSKQTEVKDVNVNKIVIKKVEKQEAPKRITYYLKPETIKKIDKFSKMAGMGKSEFVQTLLEEVLNNLEIEK